MAKINVTTTSANMTLNGNTVNVYGAGTVNTINVNNANGKLIVYDGGTVNNATVSQDEGKISAYNGGVLNNTNIAADQTYVSVYNGGKANKTTITNNGSMFVRDGGTASETTITSGDMKVYTGGVADVVTLNKFGYTEVYGGTVNNAVINSAGHLNVYDGKINNAAIKSGGDLKLADGVTSMTNVSSGGRMTISKGVADETTVNAGGSMTISGGSAVNTFLTGTNAKMLLKGGSSLKATVTSDATVYVSGADAIAADTLLTGGIMNVFQGTANDTDVTNGGLLNVTGSDGKVTGAAVSSGGKAVVSNGSFTGKVLSGGELTISGGKVTDTNIASGGAVTVVKGTFDLEISSGGKVNGFSFGKATELTKIALSDVTVGADATLYAGQSAAGITMETGAKLTVFGTAENISGTGSCTVTIKNGGKVAGKLQFTAPEAAVVFEKGGVYDFDLRSFSTGEDPIVDFTHISGTPDLMITVSNTQELGTYVLAKGLDSFTGSITFSNGSKVFGTITADGSKAHNFGVDHAYRLTFKDGTLYLDSAYEDRTPPVKPVAKASTTAATNKPVTVTATFSDDSVIREYSLDKKTWQTYTAGVKMSKNGTVYFRAADADGNMCDPTAYTVKNIDLTAPAKPTAKVNTTAIVKGTVTVTATFSKDSTLKQYSLDNKTWKTYTTGVKMAKNGTVYFRGRDAAGNYSASTAFKVTNIYTPVAKAISGVKAKTGKEDITLSWSKITPAKGDKIAYQVKMVGDDDSGSWTVTSPKLTRKDLDVGVYKFYIRSVVTAPNMTVYGAWKTVSVNLKDIVKPVVEKLTVSVKGYNATIKIDGDDNGDIVKFVVTYGKKSVTVKTAYDARDKEYEDDAVVKLSNLAVGKVSVSVVAVDAAGNKSKAKKVNLTIKDVTAPSKITTLKAPSITNKYKGTFSWSAAKDNSGKIAKYQIQLDNGKIYTSTKTTLSVSNLKIGKHTYRVRAIDKAGNVGAWSAAKTFTVKDVTAPATVSISAKVTGNTVVFSWKKPKDNVGVTKYVLRFGAKLEKSITLSASQLKYAVPMLNKGTYKYSIVAYDAAGNAGKVKSGKFTIKQALTPVAAASALSDTDFNAAPEALFAPQDDILAYSDALKNSTAIASADDLTASEQSKDKFMQLA